MVIVTKLSILHTELRVRHPVRCKMVQLPLNVDVILLNATENSLALWLIRKFRIKRITQGWGMNFVNFLAIHRPKYTGSLGFRALRRDEG